MKLRFMMTVALLSLTAWPAAAQPVQPPSALETLGAMHQTGTPIDWPEIPQTGQKADQVKQNLTKIKLPAGFHISLYALVPDARHIAVGPQGVVTFVGTRKSKVWAVTDRSRGGVGDEVKEFAPTLPKKIPNGLCFSKDGFLYIVEQNRVLEYPAAEFFYESPDVVGRRRGPGRRADSESQRKATITPRAFAGSDQTTSSISSSASPTTFRPRRNSICTVRSAWAASSAWTVTARTAKSMPPGFAIPWAWTSIRRTRHSGPTTTRLTAWATTFPRAR